MEDDQHILHTEELEVSRSEDHVFNEKVEKLINMAEDMRLRAMKEQRRRGFIAMSVGLSAICLGAGGFGWFLLVEAQLARALGAILLGIVIAAALNLWSGKAIEEYKKEFKRSFLPRLGKILGGFKYHPTRGISAKLLAKTGVIPAHDSYEAEDCFMGGYKGVKVLFCEARLYSKDPKAPPIFNGLFILLESPHDAFQGHTIITADSAMVQKWASSRWKKLDEVKVSVNAPSAERFHIYSDEPQHAALAINERLLKELAEASDIFEKSPLTAVMMRKKFMFMMIPYDGDLFEASKIHIPVTTKRTALQCKREIDKILEIIDIFEVFNRPADHIIDDFEHSAEAEEEPKQEQES